MTMRTRLTNSTALATRLCDFARGHAGAAAIEFAGLLPFMLFLYLGGIEVGDGIAIDRKVTITARAVADLASQYTTIHDSDMTTILSASTAVIAPYSSGSLAVTVSEVSIDSKGNATVTWSNTLNGTARTVGAAVTLPGPAYGQTGTLYIANTSYLWGEATYTYTPTLGYAVTGTWTLYNDIFMSPRLSTSVSRVSP
jgi:Flp pilus assembly protein TadG